MPSHFPSSRLPILCFLVLRTSAPAQPVESPLSIHPLDHHAHPPLEGLFQAGWESRYYSEGRDNLDGDPLRTATLETHWEHWAVGAWYGCSGGVDYDELQLFVAFSDSLGGTDYYFAFTHLRFPSDGGNDNEAAAGLSWDDLPLELTLSADLYYSFEAEGAFGELSLTREFALHERLSMAATALIGWNANYIGTGHDGLNHAAVQVSAQLALTSALSLTLHLTRSWGLERDPLAPDDALLQDFFHGGLGLQWHF